LDDRAKWKGAALVASAAMLWGLWPLWVRGAAGGKATVVIALLVAGLLSLPAALRSGRRRVATGARAGRAAVLGVLGLGLLNAGNSWLYFRALDEGQVAPAVLTHYLAPVLVALFAPLVLGEPRSRRTAPALLFAMIGTAALVGPSGGGGDARHAALLGGASALFYAGGVLLGKRLMARLSDAELFCYHCLVIVAMLAPVTPLPSDPAAWLRPVAGGVVSALIPGFLYYAGLRRLPAERVGVLCYLEVLAGVLVGWVALGETPSVWALGGGAGIMVAGWLVLTATRP
jgi:drug/metabolite transporter (DMT)-like permease